MKRRDMLRSAFTSQAPEPPPTRDRVPSGAVRAMGLSLGRIGEDAARAGQLEDMLSLGENVAEIDPALIDPSFVVDRLNRGADPEQRTLVDSIATHGQQVPILVRPHPKAPRRFQVAYGHRRLLACQELSRPVRAVVRPLTDDALVVAQGKENAERRNLSFVERATFAVHLEQRGFGRAVVQAALAVHPAEMTRLFAVGHAVPQEVVETIGPAPRVGRPRWMALSRALEHPDSAEALKALFAEPGFQAAGSDTRFSKCLDRLQCLLTATAAGQDTEFADKTGQVVVRTQRTAHTLRIVVDVRAARELAERITAMLPDLVARYGKK